MVLQLIKEPVSEPDESLPAISLKVERLKLAKRLWRGTAEDGTDFGFELAYPLKPGAVFWQTGAACYVIEQLPEPVLAMSLEIAPSAAAGIGWAPVR